MLKNKQATVKVMNDHGPMGYVLFMAWIGAVVYFVGRVDGFWNVVLAFLKACVWPAYVLYHVLQLMRI
jgi:hypothetical protein